MEIPSLAPRIDVFQAKIVEKDHGSLMSLLSRLPFFLQEEILKYRFSKDRQRSLLGKMLLMLGFEQIGLEHGWLDSWKRDAHQRPYLGIEGDFNISHAGDKVVCAMSQYPRIGVDIEAIEEISFHDFRDHFTPIEKELLRLSSEPIHTFYWIWTRKEALVKADGRGLTLALDQIEVSRSKVWHGGKHWYLHRLPHQVNYVTHLASDRPFGFVQVHPELSGKDICDHFQQTKTKT